MCTLTTGTSVHVTSFVSIPPAKRWAIGMHTTHVFIAPTPAVLVKITVPPINSDGQTCHNR